MLLGWQDNMARSLHSQLISWCDLNELRDTALDNDHRVQCRRASFCGFQLWVACPDFDERINQPVTKDSMFCQWGTCGSSGCCVLAQPRRQLICSYGIQHVESEWAKQGIDRLSFQTSSLKPRSCEATLRSLYRQLRLSRWGFFCRRNDLFPVVTHDSQPIQLKSAPLLRSET